MSRNARRSAGDPRSASGTATAAGAAAGGSVKKFTGVRPPAAAPPPRSPGPPPRARWSSSRPRSTRSAITPAWTGSESAAPPPSGRRATGSRRPGRGVGVEVGGAAIRGYNTPQTRSGRSSLRPDTGHPRPSRGGLPLGLLGGREADHLDTRAVGDVHGLHHVQVLPVRRRPDEQQLGAPHVRHLAGRLLELGQRVRLPRDRGGASAPPLRPALGP